MVQLEVNNLAVQYGEIKALKGISFKVDKGDFVTLIGANGAGKTTLLNALTGVVKTTSGEMIYNGVNITGMRSDNIVKMKIAHVPEGRRIFSELTVEENLFAGAYIVNSKDTVKNNLKHVYSLFPLLKERRTQVGGTLSGGEQQMLAIGRGLMSNPDILFLDEPSLGLAPIIIETIFDYIKEINKEGMTIFLVEQNANMALQFATYGYVLETGSIIFEDNSKNLINNDIVQKAYLGIS